MNVMIISGVIITLLSVANVWQYHNHQEYVQTSASELARAKGANDSLVDSLTRVQKELQDAQSQMLELASKTNELNFHLERKNALLESYRDRQSILLKKPGLVERKINQGIQKRNQQFACATNDLSACQAIKSSRIATKE